MINQYYPTPAQIDQWCDELIDQSEKVDTTVDILNDEVFSFSLGVRHHTDQHYIRFTLNGKESFYAFWQPVYGGGLAPLLVHLPGYGAEMSAHPELVMEGYNVIHVNPMGYATPNGPDSNKQINGDWPVLPDTVTTVGESGYRKWLLHVLIAIQWAKNQACVSADRIGTFGTSQGGGTALLTASILAKRGIRAVAADVPFLTDFPSMETKQDKGAYYLAFTPLQKMHQENPSLYPKAWFALGQIDTLSHVHRLTMPVLLTAGSLDNVCPPDTIHHLFQKLPGTRSLTELSGQGHAYTAPFLRLAAAWFRLYM